MELTFVNEPEPGVDALAAVWTAGDPFHDPAPTAVADWVAAYDLALGGQVRRAMDAKRFTWADGQRLHIPTGGALPFATLVLVGATPPDPREWQGWRHVGRQIRQGLREAEARRPGLLVERIFPTGLADLARGLFAASAPTDAMRFLSFTFTGGISWTVHDRRAVVEAAAAVAPASA